SIPAITSARSVRAPAGAGVPGATYSTGIGSGRAISTGSAAITARVAPAFATSRTRRSIAVNPPTTWRCRSPVVSRNATVSTTVVYHVLDGLRRPDGPA